MKTPICRWGILGAAGIARKNWQAISNASNCTLTAVASRDLSRCCEFIANCQRHVPFESPPRAYGSYEELIADDAVDALYIPLPTGVRKSWAIRAAEAGKHILLEKPAGTTIEDVREILAACEKNGVQFMDGVMFMHSQRMASMRAVLDDERNVGTIKRITSQFTFGAPDDFFAENIRIRSEMEPFGCLGDLGWYNIRFSLWAMNWQMPSKVVGHVLAEHQHPGSPAAVPTSFSGELFFDDGVSASFYCSFLTEIQQWANIGGTRGFISVPDFVLPRYGAEVQFELSRPVYNIVGCDFNMEEHTQRISVSEYSNSAANAQETNMFRHFAELALSGQSDYGWGEMTLKTQQVMEACLQSARKGGCAVALSD